MFDAHCPRHCGRILVPARHILAFERGSEGTTVWFRCWCGAIGADTVRRRVTTP